MIMIDEHRDMTTLVLITRTLRSATTATAATKHRLEKRLCRANNKVQFRNATWPWRWLLWLVFSGWFSAASDLALPA